MPTQCIQTRTLCETEGRQERLSLDDIEREYKGSKQLGSWCKGIWSNEKSLRFGRVFFQDTQIGSRIQPRRLIPPRKLAAAKQRAAMQTIVGPAGVSKT